jgi:predicted transcriptional regulator
MKQNTKTNQLTVRLMSEEYSYMKTAAERLDVSYAYLIRKSLRQHVIRTREKIDADMVKFTQPKKEKTLVLRMTNSDNTFLTRLAGKLDVPRVALVRYAVRKYISSDKSEE